MINNNDNHAAYSQTLFIQCHHQVMYDGRCSVLYSVLIHRCSTGTEIRTVALSQIWWNTRHREGCGPSSRVVFFYENTPTDGYSWVAPLHQDVEHVGVPSEGKGQAWKSRVILSLWLCGIYSLTHTSTHSETAALIHLLTHSPASHGTFRPGCDGFALVFYESPNLSFAFHFVFPAQAWIY